MIRESQGRVRVKKDVEIFLIRSYFISRNLKKSIYLSRVYKTRLFEQDKSQEFLKFPLEDEARNPL
jgi:hypothetical protein